MQTQAQKQRVEEANKLNLRLVYFEVPGRGECSRIMFHFGGIKFVDERIQFADFGKIKTEGRFKFNQLPVLYVNGKQYAQSGAINRYVGRLAGLYPENNREQQLIVDQAYDTVDEAFILIGQTMPIQDRNEQIRIRKELAEGKLKTTLENLNKLLVESGGKYYLGDQITVPDIYAFVIMTSLKSGNLEGFPNNFTDQFPKLTQSYNDLASHQHMQSYMKKNKQ